ncbi:MAG: hypothetical protein ACLQOO_23830 [Terriglobia bacterium]
MTLSVDARLKNLNDALLAFLNALGEERFLLFFFEPTDYPDVLPTTWTELTNAHLLEDMNWTSRAYRFTPRGYIRALKLSGRLNEEKFKQELGKLCAVLKRTLPNRNDFGLIGFQELVKESGVSEAFAQNALDADLIRHVFGKTGARWHGDHYVEVPQDFGLAPI